ncbi:hypothetical protein BV97_03959 [Novosphingobium resinovorum]|uniref:Uncharacterized protein n=1 Tax=Novosphingobium resinovorum TaxID=158500 RepID=A0A031JT19_9SPHN|nr:hypothetical protein [Novosphingobium resinovorum]EZP79522.1 hypothetical protein BV97_03959 [Novosphingobium resinovorum]
MGPTIPELLEGAREIAAQPRSGQPIAAFPASVALSLDAAAAQADRTRRPVLIIDYGRPVTVFPKGMCP